MVDHRDATEKAMMWANNIKRVGVACVCIFLRVLKANQLLKASELQRFFTVMAGAQAQQLW